MKEFILEIKKIIPQPFCEKIIHYFDNDYIDAGTTGHGVNKDIRNCLTRSILNTKTFGEKICSNATQEIIHSCVDRYKERFNSLRIDRISQLDLLKYEANEHEAGFNYHTDFGKDALNRHLSVSICLNNKYTGGEFIFDGPEGEYRVPQNVGDAVIFPSNFMFPHQVTKVETGVRYALIGWII